MFFRLKKKINYYEKIFKKLYPVISFCTPCMGRLHHIKKTLKKNIISNINYPNVEFVLLDYNSNDGLGDWIKTYMYSYIKTGILKYFKYPEPFFFHHSHAKNMALRLGGGDIVCLVDADNFIQNNFAFYIYEKLKKYDFLIAEYLNGDELIPINDKGVVGRFATYKNIFLSSGGYDESMEGWGYEDIDLNKRLLLLGFKPATINLRFLKCIAHNDKERSKNLRIKNIGRDGIKVTSGGSCLSNFYKSEENLNKNKYILNNKKFGCGIVYKNFSSEPFYINELDICN